jgi:putative transposase
MLKAYKYRIYPKPQQEEIFAKHFGCVRFIYNWALEKKIKHYQQENKSISCFDIKKELVDLKKHKDTEWLKEVNSQSLQESVIHLDKAFTKFFREKSGFPKFKSKHKRQSFSCPQNIKVNWHNLTVKLPKIGEVRTFFHKKFEGNVKTCTVSKTPTNKYFIAILVEIPDKPKPKPRINKDKAVGIDLGLKEFVIDSNGNKIDNPRYLRKSEERLKVLQRRASKKRKGSNNRKKANLKVAKQHEKIRNQRDDFLHKVSSKIISENQTVCLETLSVKNMMKNHKLAKSIGDASWSRFVEFLKYKAEWYGVNIVQIGKFEASSKTCSNCGWIKKDLTLEDREWICKECGVLHDRDLNAALNIKQFALQKQNLINKTPMDCGEEPVESLSLDRAVKQEAPML